MLTIYGALNSRATRPIWLAIELGMPFRHVPVVQASRLVDPDAPDAPLNTGSPAFLAISPVAAVPVIDDDGLILHESMAINLHLARKAGGPIGPVEPREDALMTMWSFWAATECEPWTIELLVNLGIRGELERDGGMVATARKRLRPRMAMLATALDRGSGWLVAGRFTVADLNAAEVMRYAQPAGDLIAEFPQIARWLACCQARPAFVEMIGRRKAEIPPDGWQRAYRREAANGR